MNAYEQKLHDEVTSYKEWLYKEHPDFTEAMDDGSLTGHNFNDMRQAAIELLEKHSFAGLSDEAKEDVMLCIARDSEDELVADCMIDNDGFGELAKACLKTGYTNAKWQLVKRLSLFREYDDICRLIYDYIAVEDEYTQRLALYTLAEIYPQDAEKYAVKFWESDAYKADPEADECRKVMVLHVLNKIDSKLLMDYLDRAYTSNHEFLKQNAKQIAYTLGALKAIAEPKDKDKDEESWGVNPRKFLS